MLVEKLYLTNYRNFESEQIDFSPGINLILGDNAVGKTNLIEAIYYLSLSRSFKKIADSSLIKDDRELATVLARIKNGDESHTLAIKISKEAKVIYYDNEKLNKLSDLLGLVYCVCFEPNTVNLFREDPLTRRQLLDETKGQMSSEYLYSLSRYKKLLKDRNLALQNNADNDYLEVLTKEIIITSYRIYVDRVELIKKLQQRVPMIYKKFTGHDSNLKIKYMTKVKLSTVQEEYISLLSSAFKQIRSEEVNRKTTLIGVHRDDIKVLLDDKDLGVYGSQGQNRLVAIALKLAIAEIIDEEKKGSPIIILDDVLSDLDKNHQKNLIEALSVYEQVFITSAEERTVEGKYDLFEIVNNRVIKRR